MAEMGLSQSELARRVNITQGAIAKIVSKDPGGSAHLHKIARELCTTPAYLTGETDDPKFNAPLIPSAHLVADQLNSVLVPYYEDPYAMGGGTFVSPRGRYEAIPFNKEWLRARIHGGFDQLLLLPGRGDSMQPTINDGDVVLIDKAQSEVRDQDLIWAFDYGELGMIKRLRRRPRGGYLVQSDNDVVKDFSAADDEINIVGRVISILRWQ